MNMRSMMFRMLVFGWLCLANAGCKPTESRIVWDKDFPVIGSQSSPRTADLNGDGVLDVVMGAGKNEFQPSVQGVMAIDGKTGEVLWQKSATDQVHGRSGPGSLHRRTISAFLGVEWKDRNRGLGV